MVKRRDLLKDLKKQGIQVDEHGGRHAKLINPLNNQTAPLPRHTEIDNYTAKEIKKQLGLK
ncbi:type II toxin-antitoxin system HicA family toxin [Lactobacillus rhamnosus]|uniref:Type II toxin-antitoxin system HicA family toxin n=1 Tax=Lacticaseibacillus rhamnosus TaxID=47715 RepID=A0A7Y7QGW2_LACRH|nr:type II toxin-antitoxin system HicA family toxin [Lacticaseibacillus rhamnosus]NVO88937.1 type II toxin-antitoxin system HicA family toxin [Lacticaseibacillus rhamnosus]